MSSAACLAASIRSGPVPGEQERQQRISQYATEIRLLQAQGKLPQDLDYRMLQLTILALASYPLSFAQVTRLVTGRPGSDPAFQRDWIQHLRKLTQMLLLSGNPTQKAAPAPRRNHRAPARLGTQRLIQRADSALSSVT
ncbi:MAG: hypothetical protein ACXW20_02960 [Burkholderiales bacterium]